MDADKRSVGGGVTQPGGTGESEREIQVGSHLIRGTGCATPHRRAIDGGTIRCIGLPDGRTEEVPLIGIVVMETRIGTDLVAVFDRGGGIGNETGEILEISGEVIDGKAEATGEVSGNGKWNLGTNTTGYPGDLGIGMAQLRFADVSTACGDGDRGRPPEGVAISATKD